MKRKHGAGGQQGGKAGSTELRFSGAEVLEVFGHALSPQAHKQDVLLLRAKRALGKAGVKSTRLCDFELRSVAWFAVLPEIEGISEDREKRVEISRAIRDKSNQFANAFFDLWLREPDTVLMLLQRIRAKLGHPDTEQTVEDFLNASERFPRPDEDAELQRVKRARKLTKPKSKTEEGAAILRGLLGTKPLKKGPY